MLPSRRYHARPTHLALAKWAIWLLPVAGSVASSTAVVAELPIAESNVDFESGADLALRAVGRIDCRSGGTRLLSTATLVEDRRTLIAVSHFNFYDETDQTIPVKDCYFELLDTDGDVRFRSGFEEVARGSEGRSLRISRATDWAILRLQTNAPMNSPPLPVDSILFVPGKVGVEIVGYDNKHRNMRIQFIEKNCDPKPHSSRSIILIHKCRTSLGASGAPLIANVNGQAHVIAIHAARCPEGGVAIRTVGYVARSIANRAHLPSTLDHSDMKGKSGADL